MESGDRRQLLVSKGWVQAVLLVMLFGFFVLGLLAYRTYQAKPPTPQRVVDPQGQVLYTAADVRKGQQVFLHNGLMEYGSVFGHGAYLGPDYTADYLRRSANFVRGSHGGPGSDTAGRRTIEDFRTNRYDERSGTLTLTAEQAEAHRQLIGHYSRFFSEPTTRHGLRKKAITDPTELAQLTAFFGWTAWAASAERPGHNYTYTNNWPPEPRVDNTPTANVVVWSVLSLIALLGGIGILFGVFGRWRFLGWHGREQAALSFRAPGDVALTPAQRACAWFFFVMAALFLLQTFVGAASQHYRAELSSLLRRRPGLAVPLQPHAHLACPARAVLGRHVVRRRRDLPRADDRPARAQAPGQARLRAARRARRRRVRDADRVVPGRPRRAGGRGHGVVRAAGLRVPRPRADLAGAAVARARRLGGHALAGHAQPAARRARGQHAVAVLPRGVRDPGLLRRRPDRAHGRPLHRHRILALHGRAPVGRGLPRALHHRHGRLPVRAARGRARERRPDGDLPGHHPVLVRRRHRHDAPPLLLRRARRASGARRLLLRRRGHPADLPDRRGVELPAARRRPAVQDGDTVSAPLGGHVPRRRRLLELPRRRRLRLLDQPADRLLLRDRHGATANHAHAAMMGVYGMLAIGLALFCLRYLIPADKWPEKWCRISFWSTNIGLAWMCFATLLPLGIAQLYQSVNVGYWEARDLKFLTEDTSTLLEWLRLPGDIVFIAGGAIPTLYIAYLGIRHTVTRTTLEEPEDILFTEVAVPHGAAGTDEASAARVT